MILVSDIKKFTAVQMEELVLHVTRAGAKPEYIRYDYISSWALDEIRKYLRIKYLTLTLEPPEEEDKQ